MNVATYITYWYSKTAAIVPPIMGPMMVATDIVELNRPVDVE